MDSFEQARRHFMDGLSRLGAGDAVGAEGHFRASLACLPDRPSTLTNLAAALLQQGRLAEARQMAARAIEVDPSAADAWLNLGLVALAEGASEEALGHAGRLLALDPRHTGALALGARALATAGQFEAAAARWRELLAARPDDAAALSSLGAALLVLGRLEEALAASGRAVACAPEHPGILERHAAVLERAGRIDDALLALQAARRHGAEAGVAVPLARLLARAGRSGEALAELDARLEAAGGDVAAWVERAVLLQTLGRSDEALASCDRALALDAGDASVWSAKGVLLGRQRRPEAALDCHLKAVALAPAAAEAWSNKGSALHALKRHEEALADFDEAIRLRPGYVEAITNRGAAEQALRRFDRALADHDEALRLDAGCALAWSNRALALNGLGRPDEALASAARAIELAPADHAARVTRVALLCGLDRAREALPDLEEAVRLDPADPEKRMDLSQLRLQCLDFARGWTDYEARFRTKAYDSTLLVTSRPRWDGHRSASPLLIWGEQGLGDQILHGSMLQDAARLPQPVSVLVDARLVPLFQRSFPTLQVRAAGHAPTEADYDEQVPIGSLGRTFRRSVEDFAAARAGWLLPDAGRVARLRGDPAWPDGLRIGISWRSANPRIGSDKSLALAALAAGLGTDGIRLIDLQYGSTGDELAACREATGVDVHRVPGIDLRDDLDGVAAIIAACDWVVTISNTVAHMAGAIGRPTLLLLPRVTGRIWYWSEVDGCSLWYPSVRILRQDVQGDWSGPLARARALLRERGR